MVQSTEQIPTQNPVWRLHAAMKKEILHTRSSLFTELDQISPAVGAASRGILASKLQKSTVPPVGELFPWIMGDILQADNAETHKVAEGWLALYIYTLFLDEHLDNRAPISPESFMAGSLLSKIGLLNLHRIVVGTEYESVFEKALNESAKGQFRDATEHSSWYKIADIDDSAEKKNHLLLACAGAMAALNTKHASVIIQFTRSIVLALQYLDDLGDWEEDYRQSNRTTLLAIALRESEGRDLPFADLSRPQVLHKLIISGALERVLLKTQRLLRSALPIVSPLISHRGDSPVVVYFSQIDRGISHLLSLLNGREQDFERLSVDERSIITRKVERSIQIVAQSS